MKNVIIANTITMIALLTMSFTTGVYAAGDATAGKTKSVSCQSCHGLNGRSTNPKIPSLAGQKKEDLITSINAYKNDQRKDPMMVMAAKPLSDSDIADLAAYYSSVK